jgi:LmbE family N-acetylglucosaminyl deacetylase
MRVVLPALAATALLAAAAAHADVLTPRPSFSPTGLPPIDAATTLLVVAPHPDDETLCCAGVIQRVLHAGGQASVVWITSGDASRLSLMLSGRTLFPTAAQARQLGARRMAEARAAAVLLGLPAAGQLFLGYPDGGLRNLLGDNRSTPFTSRTTAASAVPYPDALFPSHPYTGDSLRADFAAVLERVQPTLILAPSPQDEHPDHRAAGLLAVEVSRHRGVLLRHVRYWIVHGGEGWPSPRDLMAGVPLTPAPRSRGLAPAPFTLEPPEEDSKLHALEAYDTQMKVMAPFLLAFVRTTELFSARATVDPAWLPPPAP